MTKHIPVLIPETIRHRFVKLDNDASVNGTILPVLRALGVHGVEINLTKFMPRDDVQLHIAIINAGKHDVVILRGWHMLDDYMKRAVVAELQDPEFDDRDFIVTYRELTSPVPQETQT